ncbi:AMP-binding protein [Nibricoccus aquaticus]|uniref:AMP-binding protein n=1 Tax=Nibricoccus aquaticus TaxID=2576891 RepID=UPI0015860720|nr:AMP-binding protein [Nibricoccus aquaticus]
MSLLNPLSRFASDPQRLFCRFLQGGRETELTYADLWHSSQRYARFYRQSGLQPGEVVLIVLPHSTDLFASFMGAMLAGVIPSFMPPRTDKQEQGLYWSSHQKLFARIGAGALLTTREYETLIHENIPGLSLRLLAIEDVAQVSSSVPVPIPPITDESVALLQHSSGTTGLKKGVALSHRAILRQIEVYSSALRLDPSKDVIASWLPLYHDMGLIACFLTPLVTGTPVVMLDPFEWVAAPRLLLDAIQKYRATLCWQPNFAFQHLCRTVRPAPTLDLSSMRAWIDCSEPCRAETLEAFTLKFSAYGVRRENFHVCYAMAETVFAVTQTALARPPGVLAVCSEKLRTARSIELVATDKQHQRFLSNGAVLPGLQLRIVDEAGDVLPENRVGEIALAGDYLFSGYYHLPEETARKLRGGWYHTGDLGFIHEGELYVTGRTNDLIIVHGRNYYAHDIEHLVSQVEGVHPGRVVALGLYRAAVGSEEIVIVAETTAQTSALSDSIKQTLLNQAGLLPYDVALVAAGWLVKTTSGKISRAENLLKYQRQLSGQTQPPASP